MKKTKQKNNNRKLIAILGGMDIGTGKVPRDQIPNSQLLSLPIDKRRGRRDSSLRPSISKQILNSKSKIQKQPYVYKGIKHHLLNVASPKRKFTVVQYRKLALKAIDKIFKKNKIPILCGGTGFYIQVVVDGIVIPEVRPDWKLRKNLEKKTVKELYQMLKKIDPQRAKTIEKKNPRRLIRAIEIAEKIGCVPLLKKEPLSYPMLLIGIKKTKKELSSLIRKRLFKRLKKGMIAEVKKLKNPPVGGGLSWKRLEGFGLEYRYAAQYLQEKINYNEMIERIQKESERFARRQMTWWKSDKRVHWIKKQPEGEETKVSSSPFAGAREAEKLVKKFLEK